MSSSNSQMMFIFSSAVFPDGILVSVWSVKCIMKDIVNHAIYILLQKLSTISWISESLKDAFPGKFNSLIISFVSSTKGKETCLFLIHYHIQISIYSIAICELFVLVND